MNLNGYETSTEAETLLLLREATITPESVEELRRIAEFLLHVADLIDRQGDGFDHEHWRDWAQEWRPATGDLVVVRPKDLTSRG